jgi:hypothetical protein
LVACSFSFAFVTGCKSESFSSESGSGHKIGTAVVPATILVPIMAALLGFFVWRRSSKR